MGSQQGEKDKVYSTATGSIGLAKLSVEGGGIVPGMQEGSRTWSCPAQGSRTRSCPRIQVYTAPHPQCTEQKESRARPCSAHALGCILNARPGCQPAVGASRGKAPAPKVLPPVRSPPPVMKAPEADCEVPAEEQDQDFFRDRWHQGWRYGIMRNTS